MKKNIITKTILINGNKMTKESNQALYNLYNTFFLGSKIPFFSAMRKKLSLILIVKNM